MVVAIYCTLADRLLKHAGLHRKLHPKQYLTAMNFTVKCLKYARWNKLHKMDKRTIDKYIRRGLPHLAIVAIINLVNSYASSDEFKSFCEYMMKLSKIFNEYSIPAPERVQYCTFINKVIAICRRSSGYARMKTINAYISLYNDLHYMDRDLLSELAVITISFCDDVLFKR